MNGPRSISDTYRTAVEWIARNDSPADHGARDPARVAELVTSLLVADLFGLPPAVVGRAVVARRRALVQAGEL